MVLWLGWSEPRGEEVLCGPDHAGHGLAGAELSFVDMDVKRSSARVELVLWKPKNLSVSLRGSQFEAGGCPPGGRDRLFSRRGRPIAQSGQKLFL